MIDPPVLSLYLHIVRVAGLAGRPLPVLEEPKPTELASEQMQQVNGVYEQSRAEHRQRTIKGRSR